MSGTEMTVTKDIRHVVLCDMCGVTTPWDFRANRWFQISRCTGESPQWDPFGGQVSADHWAICSPECLSAFVNLMYEKGRA